MSRFGYSTCLLVMVSLVIMTSSASAHPADNYVARQLPACYGSGSYNAFGPEGDFRTITFVELYPDPAQLTNIEHYMLRGTIDGPPKLCQDGSGLMAWYREMLLTARLYYKHFGTFPETLTVEAYAAAHGISPAEVDPEVFEVLRNPISDELAKLKAEVFSPGDMYIKSLDLAEMEHYASLDDTFNEVWANGRIVKSDGTWRPVTMIGPALYIRVYGAEGVIHNAVEFTFIDAS